MKQAKFNSEIKAAKAHKVQLALLAIVSIFLLCNIG